MILPHLAAGLSAVQGAKGWFHLIRARLSAPVIVLDADDVVLAEIAASVDFDPLQQNFVGLFQAVRCQP
jgi:hypothetical protein